MPLPLNSTTLTYCYNQNEAPSIFAAEKYANRDIVSPAHASVVVAEFYDTFTAKRGTPFYR